MRIVAVRGEGLASLAQRFEVDLEVEPLRSCGLFAITGPTGAGKSTILDAICLALFDELPRMDAADKQVIVDASGSGKIQYNDVRRILTHGLASAFAEVDFVGQDGREYRSRWEVRRARQRADGQYQVQSLTLTDLKSGHTIGDKKKNTLDEIKRRVGLDARQFRRAVLLAQGEFDTFIRADAKDRATLLERITDTEIYAELSQAAYAKAKEERENVADLQSDAEACVALLDDEREEQKRLIAQAKADLDASETAKQLAESARRWYSAAHELKDSLLQAEKVLKTAMESEAASAPDRDLAEITRRGLAARAEVLAFQSSSERLTEAKLKFDAAGQRHDAIIIERDSAIHASEEARRCFEVAAKAYDDIGPQLDEAKRLDTLIDKLRSETAFAGAALEDISDRVDARRSALQRTHEQESEAKNQLDEIEKSLLENAGNERLASRVEEALDDLKSLQTHRDEAANLQKKIADCTSQRAAFGESLLSLEMSLEDFKESEGVLSVGITSLETEIGQIDLAAEEARRTAATELLSIVEAAVRTCGDGTKTREGITLEEKEQIRLRAVLEESATRVQNVSADIPVLRARLEEARRGLELWNAVESEQAEALRLSLVNGEPCPVCGSVDHVWREVDESLHHRAEEVRQRVSDLDGEVDSLLIEKSSAETKVEESEAALERSVAHYKVLNDDFSAVTEAWKESRRQVAKHCEELNLAALALPDSPSDPRCIDGLEAFRPGVATLARELRERLNAANDAQKRHRELFSNRERVREDIERSKVEFDSQKAQDASLERDIGLLGEKQRAAVDSSEGVVSRLHSVLLPVTPDWLRLFDGNPDSVTTLCRDKASQWKRLTGDAAELSKKVAGLEQLEREFAVELKSLEERQGDADKAHARAEHDLNDLLETRKGVIEGRPDGEVRSEYREAKENAEVAHWEAERKKNEVSHQVQAAATNLANSSDALEAATSDEKSMHDALSVKLRELNLALNEARAAASRGEEWLQNELSRLDALRDTTKAAEQVVNERRGALKKHESTEKPALDEAQIPNAIADAVAVRAAAFELFQSATQALKRDDEARSRRVEIDVKLEDARRRSEVWEKLDDLIGSANGAKFRTFAQSLTMAKLIELANAHLDEFQPRYELRQVDGNELVLQVIDRQMADEVRGIHNLSGGERFLVSLALALGLASMSTSRGVKVGSLFVDEGFGALDSESLIIAIDTLERLQRTGRRVCVISHVEEVKERVPVRVEVAPVGGGHSEVRIVAV